MATSTHTPGPWTTEVAAHRTWIAAVGNNDDDPQIWTVRVAGPGEAYQKGDKVADAKLMAAAPDLVDALRSVQAYWDATAPSEQNWQVVQHNVRAALAKAGA